MCEQQNNLEWVCVLWEGKYPRETDSSQPGESKWVTNSETSRTVQRHTHPTHLHQEELRLVSQWVPKTTLWRFNSSFPAFSTRGRHIKPLPQVKRPPQGWIHDPSYPMCWHHLHLDPLSWLVETCKGAWVTIAAGSISGRQSDPLAFLALDHKVKTYIFGQSSFGVMRHSRVWPHLNQNSGSAPTMHGEAFPSPAFIQFRLTLNRSFCGFFWRDDTGHCLRHTQTPTYANG